MTAETIFFLVLTIFGASAWIVAALQEWVRDLILRFVGHTIFVNSSFVLAFILATILKFTLYDGVPIPESLTLILQGFQDGKDVLGRMVYVGIGVGFITAALKINGD